MLACKEGETPRGGKSALNLFLLQESGPWLLILSRVLDSDTKQQHFFPLIALPTLWTVTKTGLLWVLEKQDGNDSVFARNLKAGVSRKQREQVNAYFEAAFQKIEAKNLGFVISSVKYKFMDSIQKKKKG